MPPILQALRFLQLAAAVAVALAATMAPASEPVQSPSGEPAPSLKLKTLAGQELTLDSFRGRTVVVNFWATWCAPCIAEMPSLQRMRDKLSSSGVEVIAVNLQENAARIAPFVERLGITFPVVRDHDGTARATWSVSIFPTSFVVGPDRRIAWVARGEVDWDDEQVQSRLRNLQ